MDAPTEKDAMKLLLPYVEVGDVETLTAIPREEANFRPFSFFDYF